MSGRRLAVFGAGGMGREAAWLVHAAGDTLVCFVDDRAVEGLEAPVIPLEALPAEVEGVVVAIGAPTTRVRVAERVLAAGLALASDMADDETRPRVVAFLYVMLLVGMGVSALIFGWLAFRSRVTGVYLSILTQAMTLALSLYLFQNDSGLRGNNGLSGLQNIPGLETVPQSIVSIWFFWASVVALALGYLLATWVTSGYFGSVIRGRWGD